MNKPVKIVLYVLLVALAGLSGFFALRNFGRMMDQSSERLEKWDQIEPERTPPSEPAPEPATEAPAATAPATPEAEGSTNQIDGVTNRQSADALGTNEVPELESTNAALASTSPQSGPPASGAATSARSGAAKKPGRIGLWTGLFIVSVIGLGLLIASDVSHFMGNRALKTLYNEEGEGVANPEYEHAEQVWANGRHLEAIGLMREYLQKNPREQHVAIRIAEIYEKDLRNYLAAALEYEEVLKHKLPPERWGWSAIHLCNLYFKLNQEQKAYALLRRLVKEHPKVAAAEKARKRLDQVEGASLEEIATERQVVVAPDKSQTDARRSNLPPGFRPKK